MFIGLNSHLIIIEIESEKSIQDNEKNNQHKFNKTTTTRKKSTQLQKQLQLNSEKQFDLALTTMCSHLIVSFCLFVLFY